MAHEHHQIPTARLHEISAQERLRLRAIWSELPPHIFDLMVDRLARRRLEQEQRASSEQRPTP